MAITKTGFLTAGVIVNRAAVQCGLASVADPFASTDPNFVQLVELLNVVGEDLLSAAKWSHLVTETTIVTAASATFYALPADYDRMLDNTEWNRTNRLPMLGPLSGQETQFIKAILSGTLVQVAYRIQGNTITFPIAPSNAQTLAFEYMSNNWAWTAAGAAPDISTTATTTDTVLYDPEVTMAGLRLAYLDAKGFDIATAQRRYAEKLEHAIGKNVGARLLNIGGIGINTDHLIDASNLPITGYG